MLACENLLIVLWKQTPDAATCRVVYELGERTAKGHPTGKVSVVSLLRGKFSAPPTSARQALEDLYEDPGRIVHRVAIILPHTGFVAATVRSIVLSATQRSARRQGHGVFSILAKGVSWALEGLPTAPGSPLSVPELVGALEKIE